MSSEVIDERVVSMRFDNKDFEKGAAESLSTIQKLKQALNFKDAAKGLDEIKKASQKVDMSAIGRSVDAIADKFNVMEYAAFSAIQNITNKFVNAAEQWVKSVTIEPISEGFGVYEQKMNSTMTILNNSGKSLRATNKILDQLNEYSDKTIFSLNDMTTALGKFTAQGVDAAEAVEIIKGAANEAATMGAGSAEFSRMIYNLTQAYGMGSMKILDWKSFENANVAGKEFKEQVIQAAIEVGTLDKEGRTLDKHIKVTASNFREYLSTGFMNADVMTKVFKKYADTSTELGAKADAAAKQVKTFHQLMDVLGESVASTWSRSFSYIFGNFYEARQLWTNISVIFDETIGKMNEARNEMLAGWYEGFVDPAKAAKLSVEEVQEALNKGLGDPRVVSGRQLLLDSLANTLQAILQVVKPIKEAFREFFPAATAESLWDLTRRLRDFTAHLKLSEGVLADIKDAFRGIFAVMSFAKNVFRDFLGVLIPATKNSQSLVVIFLKIAGALGRFLVRITESIRSSQTYRDILYTVGQILQTVVKVIVVVIYYLYKFGKAAADTGVLQAILSGVLTVLQGILGVLLRIGPIAVTIIKGIIAVVGILFVVLSNVFGAIENFITGLFNGGLEGAGGNIMAGLANGIVGGAKAVYAAIVAVATGIVGYFKAALGIHSPSLVFAALGAFIIAGLAIGILSGLVKLEDIGEIVKKALSKIGDVGKYLKQCAQGVHKPVQAMADTVENANEQIADSSEGLLSKIGGWLKTLVSKLKDVNLATVVTISIIGALLVVFVKVASAFYNLGKGFRDGFKAIRNVTTGFKNVTKAFKRMHSPMVETLKSVALCVMGIAAALWLLASLKDSGNLVGPLVALVATMTVVLVLVTAASKYLDKYDLESEMKTVALTILSVAGSLALMGLAFSTIADTVKSLEGDWTPLLQSMAIFGAMAAIMVIVAVAVNRFSKEGSVKSLLSMLIWTLSFSKVIQAIEDLIAVGKSVPEGGLENLWLGAILPTFAIMAGLALMGAGFKKTGVGSALTILVMIYAVKQIIAAMGELEISIDPALLEYLKKDVTTAKDVMVAIGAALLVIATIVLVLLGDKINALGKGLIKIAVAMGLVGLVAKMIEKLEISDRAMAQTMMLGVLMGVLLLALGGMAMLSRRSLNIKDFKGILVGLALAVSSISLLAYQMKSLTGWDVVGLVAILAAIFAGLYFTLKQLKDLKGVNTGPLLALVGVIIVISGAIIILSTLKDDIWNALIGAGALALVLAALGFAISQIKNLKGVSTGALIVILLDLVVISGALMILANQDWFSLLMAAASIGGVLLMLAVSMKAMQKLKPDAVSAALVGVIAILAIGAMLGLLAQYDWENVLGAAASMSLCMVALAAALGIMSRLGKTSMSLVASAASMVIAAASMIVLAYALKQFELIKPEILEQAGLALLGITAALAILGLIGVGTLAAAAAILIVTASLIVLAEGIRQLQTVDITVLSQIIEPLMWLGIVATIAIAALPGAVAFVVIAASLIILGNAMKVIAESGLKAEVLSDIATSMMIFAIAGVLLVAGSPGIILGSVGMMLLASALMQMSKSLKAGITGNWLTDIAEGLMLFGVAGIVMMVGAAGLITGGLGMMVCASALVEMSKTDISYKRLEDLSDGVYEFAKAGIAGRLGGSGLIELGQGMIMIAQALMILNAISLQIMEINLPKIAEDAHTMGENIIKGATQGILSQYATMLKTVNRLGNDIITVFKGVMQIQSPSKIFKWIGQKILQGLGIGVTDPELTKGLNGSMVDLASGMLNSFTTKFGSGLGSINDVLEQFTGKKKKWVIDYEVTNQWGAKETHGHWEEESFNPFGDMGLDKLSEDLNSLFSGDTFGGENGLKDIFKDLKLDEIDLDFATDNLTDSVGALSTGLGDVEGSNSALTKSMAKSIDMFSEYDRSLTKTTKEINQNLLDNLIGEKEYQQMINDLAVLGFDPAMITEQIVEPGRDTGAQLAKALLAGYYDSTAELSGQDFAKNINKLYKQGVGTKAGTDMIAKAIEVMAKEGKTAEQVGLKFSNGMFYINGSLAEANAGYTASLTGVDEALADHGDSIGEYYKESKRLKDGAENEKSAKEALDAAIKENNEEAFDIAMSNLSQDILDSINRYMGAGKFVQLGKNICLGLASGIWGYTYLSTEAVKMSAEELIKAFTTKTKIKSPSKVFYQFGDYLMEGLANGISDNTDAEKSNNKVVDSIMSQYMEAIRIINDAIESSDEFNPRIRPVIDMTELGASAESIRTMFDGTQVNLAARDFSNFKASLAPSGTGLISMSKEELKSMLNSFANDIILGINDSDKNIDVNVNLEGDAKGIFKIVREENDRYKRTAGYSALV